MAETWWIIDGVRQVVTDGGHPSSFGETGTAVQMTRRGNLSFELPNLSTGGWEDNIPALKVKALSDVDEKRQKLQDVYVSPGEGKKVVYAQKNAEQRDYYANGPTPVTEDRFPAALAEVAVTGDTLAVVIARFKAGVDASTKAMCLLDAIASKAKTDIQAATTKSEIEAALPVWPQPQESV